MLRQTYLLQDFKHELLKTLHIMAELSSWNTGRNYDKVHTAGFYMFLASTMATFPSRSRRLHSINALWTEQNGRPFCKCYFLNPFPWDKFCILIPFHWLIFHVLQLAITHIFDSGDSLASNCIESKCKKGMLTWSFELGQLWDAILNMVNNNYTMGNHW